MKLLIHSSEFPPGPGGIGVQAHNLAKELVRLGWEIKVVTVQSYADKPEVEAFNDAQPFEVDQVPEIHPAWREGLRRLSVVRSAIREWCPDVVMASGQRALWVAAFAGPRERVPWVGIVHGTELDSRKGWVRAATRFALRRARAIAVVSRHSAGYLRRLGVSGVPSVVIGNGADPLQFRRLPATAIAEFKERHDLVGSRLILTVGNLTARKGQEVVIRALPEVLHRLPDVRYLMAGLPTESVRLQELADDLKVGHAVRFLGRLSDRQLVAAYNACDVFAMTSQHTTTGDFEGYGIAVVEAALCGKPAVVTGDSGLEEAVVDGETAIVVPQSDPKATAEALKSLLEDTSLSIRLGTAARERALAGQTWSSRAAEYDQLLRTVSGDSATADDLRVDLEALD